MRDLSRLGNRCFWFFFNSVSIRIFIYLFIFIFEVLWLVKDDHLEVRKWANNMIWIHNDVVDISLALAIQFSVIKILNEINYKDGYKFLMMHPTNPLISILHVRKKIMSNGKHSNRVWWWLGTIWRNLRV